MRRLTLISASAAVLALAGQLLGGGFWLELVPSTSHGGKNPNVVLTVQVAGCHDPASAVVTGVATGTVDGQRRTIPLELTRRPEPGRYDLVQQWPAEGRWVIHLTGKAGDLFTNTLVAAGPKGVDRLHAKNGMKPFGARDLEAMLK